MNESDKYWIRRIGKEDTARLRELEAENDRLVDALFASPGDSGLARSLRENEIRIATITKTKMIDF